MYAQSQKKNDFSTVFDKENLLLRRKIQAGGTKKLIFTIYLFTFRSTEERRSHHADDDVYLKSNWAN